MGRRVPRTLCQPDGVKSCGACCGMYNQRDERTFKQTMSRLIERTRAYRASCAIDDTGSLERFRAEWEPAPEDKLLGELPSCPFLGLLELKSADISHDDTEAIMRGKVGCLVHPFQNDGVDGRDCGVYDRNICEDYLCAAHDVMREDEKWLVLQAIKDSYLYGLVITDTRFVRELFEHAARINGMMPTARTLAREDAIEAAASYFELKRDWPHRAEDGMFGQVTPGEGLQTPRRRGPSEQVGVEPGAYEAVLRCLGTEVVDLPQLEAARAEVASRIERFARAVDLVAR